jgi:DinB superfamily
MDATLPADLQKLDDALDAAERDARALVAGLTEALGAWRAEAGSWSVAECLDHLGTANRVYLAAMQPPAARARSEGRRRGPARPGLVGGWFVNYLEPPVKARFKTKAPRAIRPGRRRRSATLAPRFLHLKMKCEGSCGRTPTSISPECASRIHSFAVCASALRRDCTSSPRTSGVICGRPGKCAGRRSNRTVNRYEAVRLTQC